MRQRPQQSDVQTFSLAALASYEEFMHLLARGGTKISQLSLPPFFKDVQGLKNLLRSMSAVAAAAPAAHDEEWNPLSQRPHSPLPPAMGDEFGVEITALKEAVDAFTTLAHEAMHVALWEPFFTGAWRPRSQDAFHKFSLMAEGFCFFYADVVIASAVRVRFPDGEFAFERQTPSNARFAPLRAFHALGLRRPAEILEIYLDGFSGGKTPLWRRRGTNHFAAALAAQVYDFYAQSLRYLDDLHVALAAFGGLTEFHHRFCMPGLPTFLDTSFAASLTTGPKQTSDGDFKKYFATFFASGLKRLGGLSPADVARIRMRRMLQTRAYYALQVRFLLDENLVIASGLTKTARLALVAEVSRYLDGLAVLLARLAQKPRVALDGALKKLDASYETNVRRRLIARQIWVGDRHFILPRRAGGHISVFAAPPVKTRAMQAKTLQIIAFLVDECTRRMRDSKTIEERAAVLQELQKLAALGAVSGTGAQARAVSSKLHATLRRPAILRIWSLQLASFDPLHNQYRELTFSYQ